MHYPSFAPNLQIVSPHAALWHTFDTSLKADLFSTAISTAEATWLIDPIPLVPASLRELQTQSPIKGIIVTNQNHWRASADFSEELSAPIFAHPVMRLDKAPPFTSVADGDQLGETLEVITIEGAGPGEIALFTELDGGTM